MLTKSMAAKITAVLASKRLFVDNLYKIEPKKVSEELKRPGWIDAMQDKLNQFYRNKSAKKQQSVAMSSVEAEYVVADGCCVSILWMKSQLSDYDIHYKMVPIFCDNTSAIAISNNPVLDGNYSSTEDSVSPPPLVTKPKKRKSQTVTSTSPKSQGIEASGALFKKSKRPTSKKSPTETKVTLPKPIEGSEQSHSGQRLKGNKPPTDMERQNPTDVDLSRIGAEYQEDQTQSSRLRYQSLIKNEGEPSYEWEPDTQPMLEDKPTSSTTPHTKASDTDSSSDKILRKDQTDQLVEASISSFKKSCTIINDLYKDLEVVTQLLKDITKSIKDDPATNKKTEEASETLAKIFTQTTDILSLVKSLNFSTLQSTIKNIQDHAFKQKEASAAWMKSSTNMAWNLAPSSSVTLIFALTNTPANVKGKNTTYITTKEPPYHTEWETDANIQEKPKEPKQSIDSNIEFIGSSTPEDQRKLVKSLSIVCSDPDESIRVEFMINRKIVYLAEQEIQEYRDKEEEIKKAEEEARLIAISKIEVIKVVCKEANMLGIHPKEAITSKVGKLFKKAQDDEHEVHKRQHTKKVRKSLKLRKHRELRIEFALPAPEQTASQTSKKQKHIKLEPKTRIPGLECNRALPENVMFVNNMVIEEPEYEIFFTDEFGDQAFQRWSDIDKVGMEALVSHLVVASMVKSPKNARFSMKLRKLIAEHLDQEKVKSKKVKLEALGYKMDLVLMHLFVIFVIDNRFSLMFFKLFSGLKVLTIVGSFAFSMERGFLSQKGSGRGRVDGVIPSLIDMTGEVEQQNSLDDIVLECFPSLSTLITTKAGSAPGKSSYANVTDKPSGKKLNIHTLLHRGGRGCHTLLLLTMLGTLRSSYVIVMIQLRAEVELKDNVVMAMTRIKGEGYYTCNVYVEYEWKPPRCACCKVFQHVHEECPKNIGAGATKTLKKSSQTPKGILFGQKMGFKPKHVGTTDLVNNGATLSRSSFMNIDNDGEFACNNPIGEKINKMERQICEGKFRLLDIEGNPLVPTATVESDSEVEVVFDETANLRISTSGKDESDKGYGTNNLLEQWRDFYSDNDDYDPYDDDMYENHDLSEHLQSIWDYLDITVQVVPVDNLPWTLSFGELSGALIEVEGKMSIEGQLLGKNEQTKLKSISVIKISTGRLINGSSCDGNDMVIKYLDLEPKIDAMMRDYLEFPATYLDEGVDPDHNKGKTSLEVEPDTEPLITQTFGEIQALLADYEEELKDDSDEEMYEAGEEIEDETQPPPTDLKPTE
uniref:Retrovirus-related Pol polyprotein from transposon TNT 1-94 n=1 Tax=Tanacetum cinerariifolium TaxID=118510 RepID=A0A6L2NV41_TANCI|nr:retrovirus-related Pol polyprotein from transposon TNT 1-94 [Tanacetum cinerariifolium]